MAVVKTIVKRPWIHHVIIWAYIIAPVANVLLVMVFVHVPLARVVQQLFRAYGRLGAIWLLSAPLMGIALYFVNRVVWYLFLAHSSLVFVDWLTKWATNPQLYVRTIPALNHLLIVSGNLALVALIGYIIQRDFRAPYFQTLQRSFREHKRVPIRHRISLDGVRAVIDDLSITGCFVPAPVHGPSGPLTLHAGNEVTISFRSETVTLTTTGQVMRETPSGWGIRFLSLNGKQKKDVARLLRNRYALRYRVDLPAEWSYDHTVSPARLFDVSSTGAFVAAEVPQLEPGATAAIALDVAGTNVATRGRVVWVNRTAEHEKPVGFGLRFDRSQRRLVRLVRQQLGKLEQTR